MGIAYESTDRPARSSARSDNRATLVAFTGSQTLIHSAFVPVWNLPPDDEPEVPTKETCPKCGRTGRVTVGPFIWKSVSRMLFWHCGFCDHAWINDERRNKKRQ